MSSVCRRGGGVALCHEELARTTTDYNSSLVAGLKNCVQEGEKEPGGGIPSIHGPRTIQKCIIHIRLSEGLTGGVQRPDVVLG